MVHALLAAVNAQYSSASSHRPKAPVGLLSSRQRPFQQNGQCRMRTSDSSETLAKRLDVQHFQNKAPFYISQTWALTLQQADLA